MINTVNVRSSSQSLTTTGTYIDMMSHVTDPVLLGLGILP